MTDVSVLFQPLKLGAIEAANRVFMAPLTRNRSQPDGTPRPWAVEYYRQRAAAGLIVTEATQISPMGKGYLDTPGIHSDAHVAAWRAVVDAVHAAGGRIVLQLWHVGRISHTSLLPGGAQPVSASATHAEVKTFTANGFERVSAARALTLDEIAATLEDYRLAAARAKQAGFDGVEIHGANGYLPDQFLRDGTNLRDDAYGGPLARRARFMLEAVEAAQRGFAPDRVGIRIGPVNTIQGCGDSDFNATFDYVAAELAARGVAYLHVSGTAPGPDLDAFVKRTRTGRTPVVANGGFDGNKAAEWVARGWADAVAFGVPFLANPDLPQRIRAAAPLNVADRKTFYGGGEHGYTDYPTMTSR